MRAVLTTQHCLARTLEQRGQKHPLCKASGCCHVLLSEGRSS
jgi:hypothetical protein